MLVKYAVNNVVIFKHDVTLKHDVILKHTVIPKLQLVSTQDFNS